MGRRASIDLMSAAIRAASIDIQQTTTEKNESYGDSFRRAGEVLQILYPDGVSPEQYKDMLGVVRVIDKLFRIANRKDAFGESPWKDISGYGLVGHASDIVDNEEKREESK